MKSLKMFLLSCLAMVATALTGFSQGVPPSGTVVLNTITLPFTSLTNSQTYNLSSGWSVVTSVTNTSVLFTNTGFVTNTVIISTTNTTFADMPIPLQRELGWGFGFTAGISTSNVLLKGCAGLDSSHIDTNGLYTLTVPGTGSGAATAYGLTNMIRDRMGGVGVFRVLYVVNTETNVSLSMTNQGLNYLIKRGAF